MALLALTFSVCSFAGASSGVLSLEIMSYNLENLFDTVHDSGKNDWGYLPKGAAGKHSACTKNNPKRYQKSCLESDWSAEKLKMKLSQIKSVILKERKTLPDVLGVSEIENENVLAMLAAELGYKDYAITTSPDKRGIDVAVLYNEKEGLKFIKMTEHVMEGPTFGVKPTRNILEAHFDLGKGRTLGVFVNHWPSQAAPGKVRHGVALQVKEEVERFLKSDKNFAIILGDFNTVPEDRPHPFWDGLVTKANGLTDIHSYFMYSEFISRDMKKALPPGSYFYPPGMTWSLLDRFFVSPNLVNGKGVDIILSSYEIYTPAFITKTFKYDRPKDYLFGSEVVGAPNRYDHRATVSAKAGFSDHFPIVIKMVVPR